MTKSASLSTNTSRLEKWPADNVSRKLVSELVPYARNARTHSPEQVDQIAGSIREWGWTVPVLVDEEGGLIAGHGRVMAAKKLGIKDIPVMVASGWSEAQKRAYVLADNKLALNASWDNELLKVELEGLKDLDFDLDLTGFGADELAVLLAEKMEGKTDPDEIPDAPAIPVSELGDVWLLGKHRIVCGDATNPTDWEKLDIQKDFVLFTSPPYNLGDSVALSGNKSMSKKKNAYDGYKDNATSNEYFDLLNGVVSAAFGFVDTMALNVQPLANSKRPLLKWMDAISDNLVDVITWDKGHAAPQMAEGVMSSRFEWIVILSNKENASRSIPHSSWRGKYANVYNAPPQRNNEYAKVHAATFPVHLPEFMIGDLMNRSRGVVDCFLGTGTTIIAAEKLGREGRGIELSPSYVDVAIERWQNFTGQDAVLESTGQTFKSMKETRSVGSDTSSEAA